MCDFTFHHLREIYQTALDEGYRVLTLAEFFSGCFDIGDKVLVNRVDVDFRPDRAETIGRIFRETGVRGAFFFRMHAHQYNPLSFNNINRIKRLAADGNEIGLHAELMDMQGICGETPDRVLTGTLSLFSAFFGVKPSGVASHGDHTGFNNLDFWKGRRPEEFGLLYEAYDPALWDRARYVSDSEFNRWKAYDGGILREGDRRCPCEHFREGPGLIYLLIHPVSWYWEHFHE